MPQPLERETATVTRPYTRDVAVTALVEDPLFKGLFLAAPALIARLAAGMRARGFDHATPILVWKNGAGHGRHIVLDGHQRLAAARKAGLAAVHVAYREPASRVEALLWAAEQQGVRRNASREVQVLSVLRALRHEEGQDRTTKELAKLFTFAPATIDRAKQLLKQGTEAEILEVLEGKHGLLKAYDLVRKRITKADRAGGPKRRPPVLTALREALAKAIDGGLLESPDVLKHARALYHALDGQAPILAEEDADDDVEREVNG